ncbi:FAD:protein FMN transferase [Cellulomonas hominis]
MPSPSVVFEAIGTRWQIDTQEPLGPALTARVHARIDEFDRAWSRFRPDSLVSRIAREPGTYRLPADAGPLLDLYVVLEERTGGAVTPLVGRSLERLGYDAGYSLRPSGPPARAPRWDEALERDGDRLVVHEPVLLDVGAAGKGYLVDLVSEVLLDGGIDAWVVDAGGDLRHRGPQLLRVALEDPRDPSRAVGVVRLRDAALCGSATNRRTWGDGLHHVLDARTGEPTRDVLATWVSARSALVADGVATALFFADPDWLGVRLDFTYVRMSADGSAQYSLGLDGVLF